MSGYARLAQVRERYDPDSTFHTNQNMQFAPRPAER
jgi:hypothetical protein